MLFEHVHSRPCVLFLDELDSVAKLRDDQHELGELKRVVVSLLQNIDALNNQTVLLAATNHDHLLDPAVWRRFAYKVEIGLPDLAARRRLFQEFLGRYAPSTDDMDGFASLSAGQTGADIRDACEGAIRAAVLTDRTMVDATEVLRAIVRLRLGPTTGFGATDADCIKAVHDLDPKLLTMKRLAGIFNSSGPTISRRLNQGGNHAGQRTKTSDQGGHSEGHGSESGPSRRKPAQGLRAGQP
jgi:SpoVK/Ycf46/Vps4 family AAA+-type ATPase